MSDDEKGRLLQTENDEVAEGIDVDIKGSKTCQRGSRAYLYLSVSLVPNYITRSFPEGGCAIIFVLSPFRCSAALSAEYGRLFLSCQVS